MPDIVQVRVLLDPLRRRHDQGVALQQRTDLLAERAHGVRRARHHDGLARRPQASSRSARRDRAHPGTATPGWQPRVLAGVAQPCRHLGAPPPQRHGMAEPRQMDRERRAPAAAPRTADRRHHRATLPQGASWRQDGSGSGSWATGLGRRPVGGTGGAVCASTLRAGAAPRSRTGAPCGAPRGAPTAPPAPPRRSASNRTAPRSRRRFPSSSLSAVLGEGVRGAASERSSAARGAGGEAGVAAPARGPRKRDAAPRTPDHAANCWPYDASSGSESGSALRLRRRFRLGDHGRLAGCRLSSSRSARRATAARRSPSSRSISRTPWVLRPMTRISFTRSADHLAAAR